MILVWLGLGFLEGRFEKVFLDEKVHFLGAPHRPKINHGYGPGGKTVQLAISTATILKEGVVGVENGK